MTEPNPISRVRREPPAFRLVGIGGITPLSPRMVRVTLTGHALDGLQITEPAASVRLLIPSGGTNELVMPAWNGNEFLLPDGQRPTIRTFTPRRFDADALELDLDVVIHPGGSVAAWVDSVGAINATAEGNPVLAKGAINGRPSADSQAL